MLAHKPTVNNQIINSAMSKAFNIIKVRVQRINLGNRDFVRKMLHKVFILNDIR